jgi:hypothetical protein
LEVAFLGEGVEELGRQEETRDALLIAAST